MSNISNADKVHAALHLITHPIYLGWMIKLSVAPNSAKIDKLSNTGDVKDGVLEFYYNERKLKFTTGDSNPRGAVKEIFILEPYKWLDPEGKFALDIGGSIGDTAIYLSVRGAKAVWVYEPEQRLCKCAKKNFALNQINGITLLNSPATSKDIDGFADRFKGERKVLKIDCEGAEYEMIKNSKKLREFDQIMLEYHFGYINLKKKLEQEGFKVRVTRPIFGLSLDQKKIGGMQMGFIYASRIQR